MKFLDLFAGIGGFRLGLEQAGHTCVGFVEIDKFARKSYEAIFDTEGEYTEKDINDVKVELLPKADCWCFGFPCSPAGTKVKTSDGYKNVEDIVKGDLLLTHKGNYKPVVKTMNRMAPAINTIKAKGVYGLKLTDNHPVYVFNTSTHKFEWIKVAELDKKIHLLTLNINSQNQKLKLSDDQLWLLGRYVADGYLPNNGKTYTDFSIRASKREQFETHLDNYSFLLEHESRNCPEYIIQDLEFHELASRFGMGAKNKKIPQWLQDAPTDQIKVFIDGYLSGDGYVDESRTMWSTVSEDLALGLQALYVKTFHKIPAIYIRKDKRSQTFNDTYNSQIHLKDVGTLIVCNYMCTRIKSIVRQEKTIKVYNMEVKDDNSYTLDNVIVHNCQDISVAGKQGGFTNGKRSSLFFKVTGLIRELKEEDKPSYLFIENVKNLLSINKGWDFAKLLIEMDEIGYDVEWDVLDSAEVVPQHRERVFIIGHLKNINTKKVFPINLEEDYERKITGMYKLSPNERTELSQFSLSKKKRENSICSQVQRLPKSIQLKLQKIASSKNSKSTEKIRFFSKGGLQEAQKQCKTSSCIDKRKGICQLVHLPTKEMLLLWSSRKYASQGKRYLQQQGKQIDNRSVRLTNGVSKREYCFKLLTVQFYKERLFISAGDGIYWTPLCIEKVEPTRRILSDVLEKIVPEKYFLSSDKVEKLTKSNQLNSTMQGGGQEPKVAVREATKIGYDVAQLGDSINFAQPNSKTRRGRVGHGVANTLTTGIEQATLTGNLRIRKLTPLETWRLQGFPDWAFDRAKQAGLSDSQLYKQAGNSVTVPVIKAIAKRIN